MALFHWLNAETTHRWGVPIAHSILWTIGLLFTTFKGQGWDSEQLSKVYGIGCVAVIFLFEFALTYFDIFTERNQFEHNNAKEVLFKGLLVCSLSFFLVAFCIISLMGHFFCSINKRPADELWLIMFLMSTAGLKLLEVWLPNNFNFRSSLRQELGMTTNLSPITFNDVL